MRRILIFGLLALMALRSEAAKQLTVAQLEQSLAADVAARRQDSEIARRIAGIVLSERISQPTFARLIAQFHSAPETSLALTVLADRSQFLDLPASELVADAAPDNGAQVRMLQNTRRYVSETLRGLPNFLATRTINLYDDRPLPPKQGDWPSRSGLHLVGTSHAEISVSRERDDQPQSQSSAVWESKFGLVSGGEFGSTLGMILAETNDVSWSHWERSATGVVAVFRYSVPASASHFEVISSRQREANVEGTRSARDARGVSGIDLRPNINSSNVEVVRTRPAYHGSIWLNPTDGTIYRISMDADMKKGLPFRRAAILVEYSAIEIAGARYICPSRSLAISEAQATAEAISGSAVTVWMNETLFTDYHRFGSSSRIVSETASSRPPDSVDIGSPPSANREETTRSASESAAQIQGTDQRPPVSDKREPQQAPSPNPQIASVEPQPGVRETSKPALEPLPLDASPAPAETPDIPPPTLADVKDSDGFALRIDVNSLLVPAVVLDKSGRSVGGLGKEDFVVLDDGKRRAITGFTFVQRTQNTESRIGKSQTPSTGGAEESASQSAEKRRRFLIFLFDDRHMTTDELPLVQKAANRLLEQPLPGTDYAAVLSFMGVNSGITHDHTVLQAAIKKLSVHHGLQHAKEDCPDVDYYSADQIIHHHNAMEFQIAVEKARQCSFLQVMLPSEDPYTGMNNPNNPFQRAAMGAASRALAIGEEDARESLAAVRNVVQAMSKLPGERVLILVSNGFLSLSPETMTTKSEIMNLAAASEVIVNALDARGLYAGNVDASQGGSTSTIGLTTGQLVQNHLASLQANENAMSELAAGTGGRFFHNNNDLLSELEMLAAVPENSYLLEISLKDVKANGAFHQLKVKLDKPGLEVLTRKGYVAPKATAGKN